MLAAVAQNLGLRVGREQTSASRPHGSLTSEVRKTRIGEANERERLRASQEFGRGSLQRFAGGGNGAFGQAIGELTNVE